MSLREGADPSRSHLHASRETTKTQAGTAVYQMCFIAQISPRRMEYPPPLRHTAPHTILRCGGSTDGGRAGAGDRALR